MKIYINKKYPLTEEAQQLVDTLGHQIITDLSTDIDLSEIEVYMDFPHFLADHASAFTNLKFIQFLSAGYDGIDVPLFKKQGALLANGRGLHSVPIAEYILSYILSIYKNHQLHATYQANQDWNRKNDNKSVSGKTVLILGTGSIGEETAKRCQAFDMKVVGINTKGYAVNHFDVCYPITALKQVLPEADVVVAALPLNDQTYHLLDESKLLSMKKDAIVINVGRGPLIDTAVLPKVLESHLKAVVLDVLEEEPLPKESPLWLNEKIIITPHISFAMEDVDSKIANLISHNLMHYLKGDPIINQL